MISIVMDTSNKYLAVGLYRDGKCIDKIEEIGSRRQSENAIPYLSQLLEKYDLSLRDTDEMIITKGPGSYTGVRVAMTIAKTLAVVSMVKIKVVSSLAAYAGLDKCISIIDARSKKVFVCMYDQGKALMDEEMITIDECKALIEDHPDYKVVGQVEVLGLDPVNADLCAHLYELGQLTDHVEYPEGLQPTYIKQVEAKKICK